MSSTVLNAEESSFRSKRRGGVWEHVGCYKNIKEGPDTRMGGIKESFLKEVVADRS